jgi:hypothetical protein
LLGAAVLRNIAENPKLPPEIQSQLNLENINFISNDRLQSVMESTTASPAQVAEAVRVNTDARLRSLKIGLLIMAGVAMLAIFPAGQLPNYIPGEILGDQTGRKRRLGNFRVAAPGGGDDEFDGHGPIAADYSGAGA